MNVSSAKKVRSFKRLINFILKKHKLESTLSLPQVDIMAAIEMVSVSVQTTCSQPSTNLSTSKPAFLDIPPLSHPQTITIEDQNFWLSKVEEIQSQLTEAENGFREMIDLKDQHIQILTEQLQNLPAQIIQKFQQLRPH